MRKMVVTKTINTATTCKHCLPSLTLSQTEFCGYQRDFSQGTGDQVWFTVHGSKSAPATHSFVFFPIQNHFKSLEYSSPACYIISEEANFQPVECFSLLWVIGCLDETLLTLSFLSEAAMII